MSDQLVVLEVLGLPEAQGSMVAFIDKRTRRARVKADNETPLRRWRKRIVDEGEHAMRYQDGPIIGPVEVVVVFAFDRPQSHYRTGANHMLLRDNAPWFPDNRGSKDIDKLARAVLDALTEAHVWLDDSQVVDLRARKRWAGESVHAPEVPGIRVAVSPAVVTEGVLT